MATLMPEKLAALVDDQPNEFRVSTSAYRSEAMFQQELDNIFYQTWIYLCHESEIAKPGDFKSTQIGTRPVIVSRGRDGQIHAVLNACTHRGATICARRRVIRAPSSAPIMAGLSVRRAS